MEEIIYADNAATTRLDTDAANLMFELQQNFFANPSSAYKFARPVKKILSDAREKIAACINAAPNEIYFTSGGSESDNFAIKGVALANLSARPNLITSSIEHKAILNSCAAMKNLGCTVTKLPVDKFGVVDVETLQKKIRRNTKIISVMLANNEIGTIQPVKNFAAVAHERGIIFHSDAVQAVGHIPLDVKNLGVDMLSASAHKFNGPKGVGFLYIRAGLNIFPYIDGGSQENGLRAGTENFPAVAAMALALEKNCAAMKENEKICNACANTLLKNLREAGTDFLLNGSENRLPGSLSLSFKNCSGESLLHLLDLKNICVSTGSACNSRQIKISHVLKAIKIPKEYALGTLRITFGKYNTVADAEKISAALINFLKENDKL